MSKLILGRYTRGGLWSLFLMCALPLHAWTLILAFRDLSWLSERTNAWDAIGVLSYGLLFALVESALLFVVMVILGFLLPKIWEPGRRTALLGVLALVLSIWAMLSQLFFLGNVRLSDGTIDFLVRSPHPLWVIYGVLGSLVVASFLLPTWSLAKPGSSLRGPEAFIDKLGLLATFYLVFDTAALVIVIIRNL